MSFRRFVHLVVNDMNVRRCTYSLRSIDMSHLFRRPLESTGACQPPVDEIQKMEPCPLPAPAMSFCPPRQSWYGNGKMDFMLLGGKHNKVVATDQTGRSVLYDPDRHAVQTLRGFAKPKMMAVPLTAGAGGDDLYVLNAIPSPGDADACFECLEHGRHDGDEDWYPRVLPPPPPHDRCDGDDDMPGDPWLSHCVSSYAVSGDGSRIWITYPRWGTYAFDTAAGAWSRAGEWVLPFTGAAAYAPEHGLWFGLRDDRCVLCAVDLTRASARRPPVVRNVWKDLAPPAEWPVPPMSRLVHLGSAKFCIARFFSNDDSTCRHYPITRAVFTGVEVERCADADGGLRMVKHGSKLYTLLHDMPFWVL